MKSVHLYIVKKIIAIIPAFTFLIALCSLNTLAESKVDVNALASKCIACHGQKGISLNDEWPNLAGQKKGYLIKEITAFRNGTRNNLLMSPIVKNLSDSEIFALAEYFSNKINTTKLANGKQNIKGKHVRARCISCHGMTGFTVNDLWPNLAGQKRIYLQNQLFAFKNGKRKSPIMEVIAKELSKQQIINVAEYFSQQPAQVK
jgi:cytochrome c553